MKKKCSKCGEVKDLETGFYRRNTNKHWYYGHCKKCMKEINRRWQKANKKKVREYIRCWQNKNLEKLKRCIHYWQKENRGKINKRKRKRTGLLVTPYVKDIIRKNTGLKIHQITPEMVAVKREQLLLYRELKTFKKEIQNGIA